MIGAVILSPSTLDPIISEMGQKYGVPVALIKATIKQESNWDVNASRYEKGKTDASWGLMQVMLATAKAVLNDSTLSINSLIQPRVNIEAGTKFISQNLNRFGNMRDAIAAYNAGSPRLNAQGKYVNQDYVDRVTNNYNLYNSMGTGVVTEAAIDTTNTVSDTVEAIADPSILPIYIFVGLGLIGVLLMFKSEA